MRLIISHGSRQRLLSLIVSLPDAMRTIFHWLRRVAVAVLCGGLCPLPSVYAGAACVVVKKHGDSLAIDWLAEPFTPVEAAIATVKQRLRRDGYGKDRYEGLFPQANTDLDHAYVVIVKTRYLNARGKPRVSYGCGFDAGSYYEAEWAALRDLQSYSWGWTPDKGHEVFKQFRY